MQDNETNKAFFLVASLIVAGTVSKILTSDDPIDFVKMCGEIIMAVIIATMLIAFGVVQDLTFWETIFIGGLAGMGSVRSFEWIIKIIKFLIEKT